MCGRASIKRSGAEIVEAVELAGIVAGPEKPDFNLPPSREIPVVVNDGRKELDMLRWGLVPSWAKDLKSAPLMNNARAETLIEKRTFKTALEKRRCLVIVDGFFEWKKEGKEKLPFYIFRRDEKPLVFAGLWDVWHSPDAHVLRSCTVITTSANETMTPVHDRMPVILGPDDIDAWLQPEKVDPADMARFLKPAAANVLDMFRVKPLVNSVKNNSADLILPLA